MDATRERKGSIWLAFGARKRPLCAASWFSSLQFAIKLEAPEKETVKPTLVLLFSSMLFCISKCRSINGSPPPAYNLGSVKKMEGSRDGVCCETFFTATQESKGKSIDKRGEVRINNVQIVAWAWTHFRKLVTYLRGCSQLLMALFPGRIPILRFTFCARTRILILNFLIPEVCLSKIEHSEVPP